MTAPVPGIRPSSAHGSAAAETENMFVRAAVFYRLFGLIQVGLVISLDVSRYRDLVAVLALVTAVTAQGIAFCMIMVRRARLVPWIVGWDTVLSMAALVAGAVLTAPAYGHTWVYFMYPLTLINSLAIGLAWPRLAHVLAFTAALAGAYVVSAVSIHHDQVWNVLPNAGSYLSNPIVGWAVASYMRSASARLDAAWEQAAQQAAALATEQERVRHARLLHDQVLQTLETLARGEWISDLAFRSRIAAEAAVVRGLVEGFPVGEEDDLAAGLQQIISDQAAIGLHVHFNGTQLRELVDPAQRLAPAIARALVDATGEALNNVAKHAGVGSALMRVSVTPDWVTVSVLDHGCGFDPATTRQGLGLRESIQTRLREVGGKAIVDSAPGNGTFAELSVPRQGRCGAPDPDGTPVGPYGQEPVVEMKSPGHGT